MALKTRLDLLVKLRKDQADKRQQVVALRTAQTRAQEQEVAKARDLVERDTRQGGSVEEWELMEVDHQRARQALDVAKNQLVEAQGREKEARVEHLEAHRRKAVMERLAETKRERRVQELERQETRNLDDMATMLFSSRIRSS